MLARTRALLLAILLGLTSLTAACAHPCAKLEHRVCRELKDRRRCKIIEQPDRRKLLSKDACRSMLKALAPR